MINGLHLLFHSKDPVSDRAFLRDVLGWPNVEDPGSGDGWLIFKTPPTELGVHPTDTDSTTELYLTLPSGAQIGLYEPRHEIALNL